MTRVEVRALADKLADRATKIYACDVSFRRRLRGNAGRDLLFVFMRHWLSAELMKSRPHAYAKLPEGFMVGEKLSGAERPRSSAEIEAAIAEAREMERDVVDELLMSLMEAIDAAQKRGERPCLDLSVRLKLDTIATARKHPDAQLDRVPVESGGRAANAKGNHPIRTRPRKSHLRAV